MTTSGWTRRDFLRRATVGAGGLLGAGALGTAGLGLPGRLRAETGPGDPPFRVVQVFSRWGKESKALRMAPLGAPPALLEASDWRPENRERPDPERWEIDLRTHPRDAWPTALEPLYDLRGHVLHLDGLYQATAKIDPLGDAHAKGHAAVATGHPAAYELAERDSRTWAAKPSVSWRIAQHLRAQDPSLTDLVELAVDVSRFYEDEADAGGLLHFFWGQNESGEITQVPAERDPRALFQALFAGSGEPASDAPAAPAAARREHIFQLAEARFGALAARVDPAGAARLEAHRGMLADLRRRFRALDGVTCEAPALAERVSPRPDMAVSYRYNVESFFDLLTTALTCGLTRVAGIVLPDPPPSLIGATLPGLYHLVYSHGASPNREFQAESRPAQHQEWVETWPVHAEKTRHQASLVAELARRLEAIPEGDGTALDHTAIVWLDEIAQGGHQYDLYPVTIVGGSRRFRTGRYVKLPRELPRPQAGSGWAAREIVGIPLSRVQVALCQEMGMEMEALSEELTHYDARLPTGREVRVSLGGALDELY